MNQFSEKPKVLTYHHIVIIMKDGVLIRLNDSHQN